MTMPMSMTMTARSNGARGRAVRLWSVVLLGLLCLPAGCLIDDVQGIPLCEGDGIGLLTAQSVPTAEQIPCFEPLPDGWETEAVHVDQDGVRILLDSDRSGAAAAVFRFAATCDYDDAVAAPSEFDGAERYDLISSVRPRFVAERFYVVPGGCFWWSFDFDPGASAALSVELGDRVSLIDRDDLNEQIRDTFMDVEV